jgi:hypothetical protein
MSLNPWLFFNKTYPELDLWIVACIQNHNRSSNDEMERKSYYRKTSLYWDNPPRQNPISDKTDTGSADNTGQRIESSFHKP